MDAISTLALALGAAWVSGIRLYGCCAVLGWMGKLGYAKLPGQLEVLQHDLVVWTATALLVIEFVADKIPYFDSGWDAVHTFIRIPAGAVLATAAFTQYDPKIQVIAFLIGGGLAATSHTTKATTRAVVNASPEPVSNWFVSLTEDLVAGIQSFLAIFVPILAILMVAGALFASFWFLPKVIKKLRSKRANPSSSSFNEGI